MNETKMPLPDAVVTQIKSYAPEHAVRMAPVFRAIVEQHRMTHVLSANVVLELCRGIIGLHYHN